MITPVEILMSEIMNETEIEIDQSDIEEGGELTLRRPSARGTFGTYMRMLRVTSRVPEVDQPALELRDFCIVTEVQWAIRNTLGSANDPQFDAC